MTSTENEPDSPTVAVAVRSPRRALTLPLDKGPADPQLFGQPVAGSEATRRQQVQGASALPASGDESPAGKTRGRVGQRERVGFWLLFYRRRFFLVAFFIAIVIWQLVILPQHFDFLAMRERDKPNHISEKWQGVLTRELSHVRGQDEIHVRGQDEIHKPYYDIVALIFSTGSDKDKERMNMAPKTWLTWHGNYTTNLTMTWVYVFCQGDPGTSGCNSTGTCPSIHEHAVMLPCPSDYARLVGKGVAGYRYIAEHYDFRYVMKADVDSIMDVKCAVDQINQIPKSCPSWGLGLWREARNSKIFGNVSGAGKYMNEAYKVDTGIYEYYPPYMTGWALLWSGDVARFLGQAGLPTAGLHSMPTWRKTWTIEDAAIGTFIAGLDLCRVDIKGKCAIWTDMTTPKDYRRRELILAQESEDALAETIEVADETLEDFDGPLKDIIKSPVFLSVDAKDLKHCAAKCYLHADCRAFQYAKKGTHHNCRFQSNKKPRTGRGHKDARLWIRLDM